MCKTEKEVSHLKTKIRLFEDMILRSKNRGEQEMIQKELIQKELMKMRRSLQTMTWN